MLPVSVRDALNKSNDWPCAKNLLGDLVHKGFNVVKANYNFTRDGGAISTINLKDQDTIKTVTIPSGAVILNAFLIVNTALTSGGAATIDINSEGSNDLLAAEAVASFTLGAKIQCVPDFGTLADSVVTTAERTLSVSFNADTILTGDFDLYVFYVF